MATVYLANDLPHGRRVALKVLQRQMAEALGAERFKREIRLTAGLEHPNILPLFDSGNAAGFLYYVMPFFEGSTLRRRLEDGRAVELNEVVKIGVTVAEALAHAHGRGVIHRDIKPSNILLQDGQAVVADFGIALPAETPSLDRITVVGTSVGTPLYMSPEQIGGSTEIDHRSDIYSLGCVLYEMLTAAPPFSGQRDLVAYNHLRTEPSPLRERRPDTPPNLAAAIHTALSKNPADRFQTAAQFAAALQAAPAGWGRGASASQRRTWLMRRLPVALLLAVTLGIVTKNYVLPNSGSTTQGVESVEFTVALPDRSPMLDGSLNRFAISPVGDRLVYVGPYEDTRALFIRRFSEAEARAIAGTEGAEGPFFSPDGSAVGFIAQDGIWRVPIEGGQPIRLADAPEPHGAVWLEDGSVVFAPDGNSGLSSVSSEGGPVSAFTVPDTLRGETTHRWPAAVPGRNAVFFVAGHSTMSSYDDADIFILDIDSQQRRFLTRGTFPKHAGEGILTLAREKRLYAAAFDAGTGTILHDPVSVLDDLAVFQYSGRTVMDVSTKGTMAYLRFTSNAYTALVRVQAQNGSFSAVTPADRPYRSPRLSPQGDKLAVVVINRDGSSSVWVHDLARGTRSRLTFEALSSRPIWSPDGGRLVFGSTRDGPVINMFTVPADGSTQPTPLIDSDEAHFPTDWLADGTLLFEVHGNDGDVDLWRLSPGRDAPNPLLSGPFDERLARGSNDGQLIAYISNETGRDEVYVRSIEPGGGRVQISIAGGTEPAWSPSSDAVYFRSGTRMMMARRTSGSRLAFERPELLFDEPFEGGFTSWGYEVLGQDELLMIRSSRTVHLHVMTNWFDEVRGRLNSLTSQSK